MTANIAKLVYFEKWMNGHAVDILERSDVVDLVLLQFASGLEANEAELQTMHGYQILPRTELDSAYLADPAFVERMPNLLAISSTGAGLDVWWQEPTPIDHPLLQFDNVIATPHHAGLTEEAMENIGVWAAEQWIELFQGQVPPRLINPEVWAKYQQRFEQRLGFRPDDLTTR